MDSNTFLNFSSFSLALKRLKLAVYSNFVSVKMSSMFDVFHIIQYVGTQQTEQMTFIKKKNYIIF